MGKFDLASVLGTAKVSNLDTGEMQEISLHLIDPNPNNFFAVEEDITDLCESIKLNGLLQAPVVVPADEGRYRLIAGHRRHKALSKLAEEMPEKYKTVLCRIAHPSSPDMEELMLIQTNTEARELGWSEKNEAASRVEKILVALQKQGVELPGKMRTHVAKIIKTSESQIARAQFIAKNLIRPLRGGSGISDSAAYKLAHLPIEQQQDLYEHYKKNLYMLDNSRIKAYETNLAEGRDPFYVPPPAPRTCYEQRSKKGNYKPCDHCDVIEARKKKKLPSWQKCGYQTCCANCGYRFDCPDLCPHAKASVDKHKQTNNWQVCQALRAARERKSLTVEAAAKKLNLSETQLLQYETAQTHTVGSLTRLCELYDTTPNEVLCVTSPVSNAAATAAWQPLTPECHPKDGELCLILVYDAEVALQVGGEQFCTTRTARWMLSRFVTESNGILIGNSRQSTIAGWMSLSETPPGYTLKLRKFDNLHDDGGESSV